MYAVIQAGGRQLRVQEGDVVHVDKMSAEAGESVVFDQVLLIGGGEDSRVGTPMVDGARVEGTVVAQKRDKKVLIYTYKPRQNANRKSAGHRQHLTAVKIDAIQA
ncbi:50S ribosomal protein L21 [Acidobacteria bacterium Mor1]|nr:50S ribosomal protein L21 [Acidobacteria bacterium Mor1]